MNFKYFLWYHGLYRASLDYWLETGTVSGELLLAVRQMIQETDRGIKLSELISNETDAFKSVDEFINTVEYKKDPHSK